MQYLIAGGGEFGTRYLRKLQVARNRGNYPVESVTVFDIDPDCRAKEYVARIPFAHLELANLREFGNLVWARRDQWKDATWIPAPVAPHLICEWITKRLEGELAVRLTPVASSLSDDRLPFLKSLPDGRILLSHAPGICPVSCTEPANCAITNGRRWWEMRDTIADLVGGLPPTEAVDHVSVFFGEHHNGGDGYAVGGIPMATIYAEYDRLRALLEAGAGRIGIATISSCHGVLNLFEVSAGGDLQDQGASEQNA